MADMYVLRNCEYTASPRIGEGFIFILINEGCDPDCPLCQTRLIAHDWNARRAKRLDGTVVLYQVEDRICPKCGRMHRCLPDVCVPHKHYASEAINDIISDDIESTLEDYPDTANESTIKRYKLWWAVMLPYFLAVGVSLAEKLGNVRRKAMEFYGYVRETANSGNWTFPTRLVLMPG